MQAPADNSGLSGDTYHNNPGGLTSGMALGCGRRAPRAVKEYIAALQCPERIPTSMENTQKKPWWQRYADMVDGRFTLAVTVLFILVTLLTMGLLNPVLMSQTGGLDLLENAKFYTPSQLFETVNAYGETGRACYVLFDCGIDLLIPVVLGLFFSALTIWLAKAAPRARLSMKMLAWLGVAYCCGDWLENACLVSYVLAFPMAPDAMGNAACFFSLAKTAVCLVQCLLAVWCLVKRDWGGKKVVEKAA